MEATPLGRLEGLTDDLRRERRRIDALEAALAAGHRELKEENAALRECLEVMGVMGPEEFLIRMHKRRFKRVLCQHPLHASGASLEAMLRTRELSVAAVMMAGPDCVPRLASACRVAARGMGAVMPQVAAAFPPAIYAVGGAGGGRAGPVQVVERFSAAGDAAGPAMPLPEPRAVCATVTMAGQVYVIAGRGAEGVAYGTVERYNPYRNVWHEAPPLRQAGGWVAAAGVGDWICVLGGENDVDHTTLDVAERLDAGAYRWSPLPAMCCPRWAGAAASIGGHVYVAGGHGADDQVLDTFECLARGMREWKLLPPLRQARAAFAMGAVGGSIYAAGGYDRQERVLRSLERFNPACGSWEELAHMGSPRWGCGAAVTGGRLYVVGGSASLAAGPNVAVVRRFDPEAGTWESSGRLLVARRCCGVTVCR